MPDQNPVDPTATGPTSFSNLGTSTEPPPPPAMDGSDLPPAPPIVEPAPETPPPADAGGAAPSFDISSSISGTPPPKKKFGGRRFVATILGLLVLVGGLGAGIILVQQQQDIRERASVAGGPCKSCVSGKCRTVASPPKCDTDANECSSDSQCAQPTGTEAPTATKKPSPTQITDKCFVSTANTFDCGSGGAYVSVGKACQIRAGFPGGPGPGSCKIVGYLNNQPECECIASGATGTITSTPPPNTCTIVSRDPLSQGYCDRSAPNTADCTDKTEGTSCTIRSQCGGGTGTCVVINQGGANSECQCQKGGGTGTPTPSPTVTNRPGGGVTAQCLNIRAFDANWTELTADQLKTLRAGDKVRFTVGGTSSSGSFDKAKFKINGAERPEVTGKRPNSQEFFDEYTLPAGVTTFTINAQIHHSSLGWSK